MNRYHRHEARIIIIKHESFLPKLIRIDDVKIRAPTNVAAAKLKIIMLNHSKWQHSYVPELLNQLSHIFTNSVIL